MILFELVWRFMAISLLAFGSGSAALSLIERTSVGAMGWVTPPEFAAALGFSYVTPGPVLILATFIGYRAAGLAGAMAATIGVFSLPCLLAAAAARQLQRFMQHPWLKGFGKGAAPAVVGLLGVTALNVGQHAVVNWGYALIALVSLAVAARTKVNPILILLGSAAAGVGLSFLPAIAPVPWASLT